MYLDSLLLLPTQYVYVGRLLPKEKKIKTKSRPNVFSSSCSPVVVRDEPHLIAVALLHPETLNQFTFNSLSTSKGADETLNPSNQKGGDFESFVNVHQYASFVYLKES